MRRRRPELDELLAEGLALVDGAVVSALIEADPDPRAAARQILLSAIDDRAGGA